MHNTASASEQRCSSLPAFFLLTLALAVPFWVFGAMSVHPLMPGLPVAALMFVCPGLAALIWLCESGAPRPLKHFCSGPSITECQAKDLVRTVAAAQPYDFGFVFHGSYFDPRVTGLITTIAAILF